MHKKQAMQLRDIDINKEYSYADYYAWKFDDRVELINGHIYKMMPGPSSLHQEICGNIYSVVKNYLQDKSCKIFFAPFDVRLPKKGIDDKSIFTVLQPDICVICDLSKIDRRGCVGAPDIVVEILSRGNNSKELKKKYEVYEESGVLEYWIVSPQYQTVTIYTLTDGKFHPSRMMTTGDIVTSSVLPGFELDLTEIFKDVGSDED